MIKKLFTISIILFFLSTATASSATLRVAAASNFVFAFQEFGRLYEKRTGDVVSFTFSSSGALSKQIVHGAPFDIFASADMKYINSLKADGMIANERYYLFCRGRLAIVVNRDIGSLPSGLKDLINDRFKKIAIANPEHAPYGSAAKEAMMNAGIWDAIRPRLAYAENIRHALQYIQTGNAEAGIVALSLVKTQGYDYLLIDETLHSPIEQAVAVIKGSKNRREAEVFLNMLLNEEGKLILERYGFEVLK